jgi:hypothetical protein
MERNPYCAPFLYNLIENSGFLTAKSRAHYTFRVARGKSIKNKAVFVDHNKPLRRLSHSFFAFPTLLISIIAKIMKKCKDATKKS